MITPTIGRQVWFRPCFPQTHDFHVLDIGQAFAATVIYVHDDHCVNLKVIDHIGIVHTVPDVYLLQDEDTVQPQGNYAEWMPYQKAPRANAPTPFIPPPPPIPSSGPLETL